MAYDDTEKIIKHFRVDKMLHIEITEDKREGKECFSEFDMAVYARKVFGMYSGKEERVKIHCENALAGVIIDRFGKDIMMVPDGDEHFNVNVNVAVSKQFIHWIMALGDGATIVSPQYVVDDVKEEIKRLCGQYNV